MEYEKNTDLPLKLIKRILRGTYHGEISKNSCIYVQKFFRNIFYQLQENVVIEFEEYNLRRLQHGLPRLKRLNKYVIKRCLDKIIKQYVDNISGEEGEKNKKLPYQNDTLNSKYKKSVIEEAGIEVV
jgi:hypothetical protein